MASLTNRAHRRLALVACLTLVTVCWSAAGQAHKSLQETTPSLSARQKACPAPPENNRNPIQADVRIVGSTTKDRYDKAAFWISVALAVVGFLGICVGIRTLRFLKAQTLHLGSQVKLMTNQLDEMRAASEISKDAVNAAYGSVRFAEAQFELMKEKERARITIKAGGLHVQEPDTEHWNLETTVQIRNLGPSRAIIRRTSGEFVIRGEGEELPHEAFPGALYLPEDFIDPCTSPIVVSLNWFHWEPASVKALADDLHNGKRMLHLYGFIEYETLGMTFTEPFSYFWMPGSMGLSIFALGGTNPTDAERVEEGHWWDNRDFSNGVGQDEAT